MEEEIKVEQPGYDPLSGEISGPVVKAKDSKQTIKKLIKYISPQKKMFLFAFALAIGSTVFSIAGPRIMGRITTTLVDGIVAFHMGTGLLTNFSYMRTLTIWLLIIYVVSAICSFGQEFLMARTAVNITYKLRTEISEKIHRLPINYYDTRTPGEVLSRVTNDVDMLSQTLGQNLIQLVRNGTLVIGVMGMMFWISPLMTISALVVIPLFGVLMGIIMYKSSGFFKSQQEAIGEVSSIVDEVYSGINIVRSYNGEEDAEKRFDKANMKLKLHAWKAQFVTSIVFPVFSFIDSVSYILVCVLGGYLVVRRVITIGDVQAFIQYMQNFIQPLGELGSASSMIQSMIASAERVFEFLEEEEEIKEDNVAELKEHYHGAVTFENVSFGYNPDKIIINDFSVDIEPGQTVAIVGPTGAGKTTIVKLLMRFYELNAGNIKIDNIPTTDFTRKDLRDIFGMVLQDTWLYNESIMENIRYGSPHATDEDVIKAAKAAQCHNFIKTLPGGYSMVLNEEAANISQGQKQLFTIARVVLKDPSILILDEATSSIDTRTEILIQKAMNNIMKGRTSFVIAHRLSTIKDADMILVMKDGDIIEKGNHNYLLEQNGFYADLYNSQFEEEEVA